MNGWRAASSAVFTIYWQADPQVYFAIGAIAA